MGDGVGAFEGTLVNGKITKGSKFTHWFKDINIDYISSQTLNEYKEELYKLALNYIKMMKNNYKQYIY